MAVVTLQILGTIMKINSYFLKIYRSFAELIAILENPEQLSARLQGTSNLNRVKRGAAFDIGQAKFLLLIQRSSIMSYQR